MIIQLLFVLSLGLLFILIRPKWINYSDSIYAFSSSCLGFLISLCLWVNFDSSATNFQYLTIFGFPIGIDGISLHFILLTTFLFPICILASWGSIHTRLFLTCFLIIEILLVLVFTVIDLLWFYIFFESILIPIFLIIGFFGTRIRKIRAAYFFFIYTLVGSLFILGSILYIYSVAGTSIYSSLCHYSFTLTEEKFLWLGFFLSFAVKVPIVPFHIWLPEAHVEAPTPGSAILAGILLKLGTYGFIRYSIPLFPHASVYFTPFVFTLGVIGIFYTSLTAIRQTDLKRIIAYTSVAHINLVVLGIFSITSTGIHGCLIQSLSHGFVSAALFLLIGTLYDRYHTRLFLHYGGLIHVIPIFGLFLILFTVANIAIPGTSSFVGEFLLLVGLFEVNPIVSFFSATSLVLSGIYSLWLLNRILYGNLKIQYLKSFTDLNKREISVLLPLILVILYIGIYPELFLESLHGSLNAWTFFV
jgi:proton-translocating NADH-quinone oxidoreductase chain M